MLLYEKSYFGVNIMNKKILLALLTVIITSCVSIAFAYDSTELNRRLVSCTPTKDFNAGNSLYQISGLTGSTCIYKIQNISSSSRPDLICKVPYSRMSEMTSYNPLLVQKLKNKYCVISIKSFNKSKNIY